MTQGISLGCHISRSRAFARGIQAVAATTVALLTIADVKQVIAQPQSSTAAIHEALHPIDRAEPTPAWIEFCERLPHECVVDVSETEFLPLDQRTWTLLKDVNESVNHTILSATDQDHWGVVDRWDYPDDGLGDCEDIQLLKRKRLIAAGLPRRALRMTVVIDEDGAGHAVLMVRTDRGDLILDNKSDEVLPWQETIYRYVKREGVNSRGWVMARGSKCPYRHLQSMRGSGNSFGILIAPGSR